MMVHYQSRRFFIVTISHFLRLKICHTFFVVAKFSLALPSSRFTQQVLHLSFVFLLIPFLLTAPQSEVTWTSLRFTSRPEDTDLWNKKRGTFKLYPLSHQRFPIYVEASNFSVFCNPNQFKPWLVHCPWVKVNTPRVGAIWEDTMWDPHCCWTCFLSGLHSTCTVSVWAYYRGDNTSHCYWYSFPLFVYYALYQLLKGLIGQLREGD